MIVRRPATWLLAEGWKRHGRPISAREVPSGRSWPPAHRGGAGAGVHSDAV